MLSFKKIIPLLFLFFLFGSFLFLKNGDETALAQTAPVCGESPSDVVLTIDRSQSMTEAGGSSGTKLSNAKSSARRFVDILSENPNNRVGLSSFSTEAGINAPLSRNWENVKTEISNLSAGGDTCTECGVFKGNKNIHDNGRAGMKKVVILLTDGRANVIQGSPDRVGETQAENAAIAEVKKSHKNDGTIFFTIGLGNNINASFLREIANLTGGKYYASPTTNELNNIYDQISQIIAKGTINGVVFNDVNGDGIKDNDEPGVAGWNVQLSKTGTAAVNKTTNSSGAYSFGSLCAGTYTVKQTLQQGWEQTLPTNNGSYTRDLTNGSSFANTDFGIMSIPVTPPPSCTLSAPTLEVTPDTQTGVIGEEKKFSVKIKNNDSAACQDSTIVPSAFSEDTDWDLSFPADFNFIFSPGESKTIDLSVIPPSSGINGPNTITVNAQKPGSPWVSTNVRYVLDNPPPSSPTPTPLPEQPKFTDISLKVGIDGIGTTKKIPIGGNKNPLHPSRQLTAKFYSATDTSYYPSWTWTFTYNPTSQKFEALLDSPDSGIQSGIYNVYVEGPQVLRGRLPGSVTITKGQSNVIPTALDLITGDINKVDRSNNNIDINDYNVLISCSIYSQDRTACESDPNYETYSDLDDNGIIDEDDFTLWLKEVANQGGSELPE